MSQSGEWRGTLLAGDRVSFERHNAHRNQWWRVRAVGGADDRFVVLTQQRVGKAKGELAYTIIDWDRDVRGPCNQIGQGWEFNPSVDPDKSAQELLRALEAHVAGEQWWKDNPGETVRDMDEIEVEVSYRNNVPIRIVDMLAPGERPSRRHVS